MRLAVDALLADGARAVVALPLYPHRSRTTSISSLRELKRAADKAREPDPVIYDHLGDVYRQRGDVQEAVRWWERALKLDAGATEVREKLKAVQPRGSPPTGE